MHNAAVQLVAAGGDLASWPQSFEGLQELPGVGVYTAAAVGSIAFGLPVPVVDGNVERLLCRIFDLRIAPNIPALKVKFFNTLSLLVPKKRPGDFNQGLMELGQTICTVTRPKCKECPLKVSCLAFSRESQALAPAPKVRKVPIAVDLGLVIIGHSGRIGLTKRPGNARFLKEIEGFSTYLRDGKTATGDGFNEHLGESRLKRLGTIKHTITNHKISAEVFIAAGARSQAASTPLRWLKPEDVERSLVANLDRKAWKLYERHLADL
jgi:A/G-specific adenine glycosylase